MAKKFTVHLLGKGMPSFYVADLGTLSFTLGLSGWTANDWSTAGNFDLMAPRAEVDSFTQKRVFEGLKESWYEEPVALAKRLSLDRATVLGALSAWSQAGRAIYDLERGVYRARELSREPLPMDQLRFANEREASATELVVQRQVNLGDQRLDASGHFHLAGVVREGGRRHQASLVLDEDERLKRAECTCAWHFRNKLRKGPCEHILALRIQSSRQTN